MRRDEEGERSKVNIFVLDNYDSFTYNLVQYIGEAGHDVTVRRNDRITAEEIKRLNPDLLLLSPGPGRPEESGILLEAIRTLRGTVPIYGVCLGHQAIAEAYGGEVIRAKQLMHGKTSLIYHDDRTIFKGLPNPFRAARYHSLIVNKGNLPPSLEVSAWTADGEIMGLRHAADMVEGVQFHPESIMTEHGRQQLSFGSLAGVVEPAG
ncbi:anthranilate synthase component II [Bacillus marinisedimentorum]|uniref:anthranilate synthase component II n=1 Tax=Bacillus marinisedimentorum TaxID=1821260 RepID=UPI0007E11084|nr:aminodeoxychorismate/anthranilate synthase component II [Bacillus marinisedimentorum]